MVDTVRKASYTRIQDVSLVVSKKAKRQILDRAWELSLEEGYVISVVIMSQEAFEQGPLSLSEFARNIRREGVEIAA